MIAVVPSLPAAVARAMVVALGAAIAARGLRARGGGGGAAVGGRAPCGGGGRACCGSGVGCVRACARARARARAASSTPARESSRRLVYVRWQLAHPCLAGGGGAAAAQTPGPRPALAARPRALARLSPFAEGCSAQDPHLGSRCDGRVVAGLSGYGARCALALQPAVQALKGAWKGGVVCGAKLAGGGAVCTAAHPPTARSAARVTGARGGEHARRGRGGRSPQGAPRQRQDGCPRVLVACGACARVAPADAGACGSSARRPASSPPCAAAPGHSSLVMRPCAAATLPAPRCPNAAPRWRGGGQYGLGGRRGGSLRRPAAPATCARAQCRTAGGAARAGGARAGGRRAWTRSGEGCRVTITNSFAPTPAQTGAGPARERPTG